MERIPESAASADNRTRVRDQALLRISRTRRWILAGAAALSAGLAGLASAVLPGKSFGSSSRSATNSTQRSSTPPLPAPASAAQLGLQSPGQAPQASPAPQPASPQAQPQAQSSSGGGAVVSGGS